MQRIRRIDGCAACMNDMGNVCLRVWYHILYLNLVGKVLLCKGKFEQALTSFHKALHYMEVGFRVQIS